MSFPQLGLIALVLYLVAMLGVAEAARRRRREDSPADHFLGGRELGVFVLFLTLYATAYSGNSLLGYPGKAYRSGFSFISATGFMLAIIVLFHALVPKLRPQAARFGFVTPGDWVRHRFQGEAGEPLLTLAVGLLMAVSLGNFLLAQLMAMGKVTSLVTGGAIAYPAGVVGMAALILFYENRGGMRAVAWTDAAQGILMFVGLGMLLLWLLDSAGGLATVTGSVAAVRPAAVAVPDAAECASWFSTIALLGIASVIYPQAIQRIYAARSGRALSRSFAIMTFMPLVTTLVVTLIGVAAIARVDIEPGVATDDVLPMLLLDWATESAASRAAAICVFLAALSAIMSTADSCLLSLGSLAARDVLGRTADDARSTRLGKALAAGILLSMIPVALQEDVTLWRLIELKMELLIQCAPAFLLAIHWRRQRAAATAAGLGVGTLLAVGLTLADVSKLAGVHIGIVALAVNVVVVVGLSVVPSGRGAPRTLLASAPSSRAREESRT